MTSSRMKVMPCYRLLMGRCDVVYRPFGAVCDIGALFYGVAITGQ